MVGNGNFLSRLDRSAGVGAKDPLFVAVMLVALIVHALVLPKLSGDLTDFYVPWYNHAFSSGFSSLAGTFPSSLGNTVGNYAPTYYYNLLLLTWFDGWLPSPTLIKLGNVPFLLLLVGATSWLCAGLGCGRRAAWRLGALSVLAPVTVANSSYWGQCDVMYGSWVVLSVAALVHRRPALSAVAIGLAFSYKAQAALAGPLYAWALLTGAMAPWHPLLGVGAWLATLVPAALAGRPWRDLLTVYFSQFQAFDGLNLNAPNFWVNVSDVHYVVGRDVGLVVSVAATAALIVWAWRRWAKNPTNVLLLANLSTAGLLFVLPKMHDRYLILGNLLSLPLLIVPGARWVFAVWQVSSLLAYFVTFRMHAMPMGKQMTKLLFLNPAALFTLAGLVLLLRAWVSRPEVFRKKSVHDDVAALAMQEGRPA